jgi:hypothetical protein
LVLRHITSTHQKVVEKDLKTEAPMVKAELEARYGAPLTRAKLPTSGPIIVYEYSGLPWQAHAFRATWREMANAAGVPENVKNTNSRLGAKGKQETKERAGQARRI